MAKKDLDLLTEEYLKLKPTLSKEAQEYCEKLSSLVWAERTAKNEYIKLLAENLNRPISQCVINIDPEE